MKDTFICSKCKSRLPCSERATGFYKKLNRVRVHSYCKKCNTVAKQLWVMKNRKRASEYQRMYYHKHLSYFKAYMKRYRKEHKGVLK